VDVAGELVLRGQPGAEQQWVVCPERNRDAGLEQGAERYRFRVGSDAERDVGGGADLTGDAVGGQALDDLRVFRRADAVPETVGMQQVEGCRDARRADKFAGVRDASLASIRASMGCLVLLAAMTIPMPMSADRAAFAAASSSSSTNAVIPPYMAANPEGSAWSSSQPEPSDRSSSAISLTSRYRSSGARSTDRAASYKR